MDYNAHMELVQDQQVQDARHLEKVIQNDNKAWLVLTNFKAKNVKKAGYGSALVPAILIGGCILVTCVAIWGNWL